MPNPVADFDDALHRLITSGDDVPKLCTPHSTTPMLPSPFMDVSSFSDTFVRGFNPDAFMAEVLGAEVAV